MFNSSVAFNCIGMRGYVCLCESAWMFKKQGTNLRRHCSRQKWFRQMGETEIENNNEVMREKVHMKNSSRNTLLRIGACLIPQTLREISTAGLHSSVR